MSFVQDVQEYLKSAGADPESERGRAIIQNAERLQDICEKYEVQLAAMDSMAITGDGTGAKE